MFLLFFVLRKKINGLDEKRIFLAFSKVLLASFLAGAAIQLVKVKIALLVDIDTFVGIFFQLASSLLAGIFIFSLASYLFRLEEFFSLKNSLTQKLFKPKRIDIEESTSDVSGV
jgi:hypothetical protein